MDRLFPYNLISNSNTTQKQLETVLSEYPNFSKSFITIAVCRPETREWYENNWQKLHKYLDKNFAHKFRLETEHESCLWEFHIASVLYDHGLKIKEKTWDLGPDFCLEGPDNKKIWIEAIICTPGKVDAVPPKPNLKAGEIYTSGGNIEDINRPRVLRILNAIGTKYEKYKEYLNNPKSGVSESDYLIIAVSGANIEFASYSDMLLKRAVFGVGPDVYHKDPETNKLVGPFYKPTPEIVKKTPSGEKNMPANFMEMEEFSNISAVLYCGHHAYNCKLNGHKVGDDFLFAYHTNPLNPIPDKFFDFGVGIHKNTTNSSIAMQSQSLTVK